MKYKNFIYVVIFVICSLLCANAIFSLFDVPCVGTKIFFSLMSFIFGASALYFAYIDFDDNADK